MTAREVPSKRPWYDYFINYGTFSEPFAVLPKCANCGTEWYAGHICPHWVVFGEEATS